VAVDGTEERQKELQELRVAAQTVVESVGSTEESDGNLADGYRRSLRSLPSTWLKLLGIVWRMLLVLSSHTGLGKDRHSWRWHVFNV